MSKVIGYVVRKNKRKYLTEKDGWSTNLDKAYIFTELDEMSLEAFKSDLEANEELISVMATKIKEIGR